MVEKTVGEVVVTVEDEVEGEEIGAILRLDPEAIEVDAAGVEDHEVVVEVLGIAAETVVVVMEGGDQIEEEVARDFAEECEGNINYDSQPRAPNERKSCFFMRSYLLN